ncbi:amidohydrolase [Flavobacteriaceae bacterium TP-CH-4]|uniref:Omega-amidase YafV n=1 Tax=Pelagihabitans pacificus TaxID=2696054 RepID=A0A967ARR8_9FLAO|nr:amidohydrolase [Pelagihabitans pacificus]NHF58792.1 amidohydrolase [Pelagihabitans pacificus]
MEEKLQVALVQSEVVWENPDANFEHFSQQLDKISKAADLILLPEMFTTGFTMHPEKIGNEYGGLTLDWMRQKAIEKKAALAGSLPFYENGSHANRLFFVLPDGNYYQYDKRHTFTLAGEDKVYKAGAERLIVSYKGFKICPMICYDLRFPVWARNTVDYDVLFYVANWPKPRIAAWDTLLKARAIENMAYCIGLNRVGTDETGLEYPGHSAVYDGLGEQLVFSMDAETRYATLHKEHLETIRKQLRFLEDRDQFTLST